MRIVVDAMGSDNYPHPDVEGAVMAARDWGDEIILVGQEGLIERELARYDTAGLKLEIVHAPEVIEMEDEPTKAAREKQHSSMHVGMDLVRTGQADAYFTAGNTGGVLVVATLYTLRRIRGVKRPALATILPLPKGHAVILDIGANADCRPEYLVQFARMGAVYAHALLGRDSPTVALLSNGEEPGKGSMLVKDTYKLLTADSSLHFIGNVEPKEALASRTDVIVTDGFAGNVFLKSLEAMAGMLFDVIKDEITAGLRTKIGGYLAKPAFRRVYKRLDPFEVGGGPLLGVNGVVIVGHGRSNGRAIRNGIGQARQAVQGNVVATLVEALAAS